jgi:hypothetical protein
MILMCIVANIPKSNTTITLMSVSKGTISEVTMSDDLRAYGAVEHAFLQLFTESTGKLSFRMLLVMQDHTLLMVKNGKVRIFHVAYLFTDYMAQTRSSGFYCRCRNG